MALDSEDNRLMGRNALGSVKSTFPGFLRGIILATFHCLGSFPCRNDSQKREKM